MNGGGMVGYVSDDESFNYDNAMDIAFYDYDGNDDFMEEKIYNLFDYDNAQKGTSKKNINTRRKLMRVKMIVRSRKVDVKMTRIVKQNN